MNNDNGNADDTTASSTTKIPTVTMKEATPPPPLPAATSIEIQDEEELKRYRNSSSDGAIDVSGMSLISRRKSSSIQIQPMLNANQLKERLLSYRDLAAKALKNKKIFRIMHPNALPFQKIREELEKRGYIETVVIPMNSVYAKMTLGQLAENADDGNEYKRILMTRLVNNTAANTGTKTINTNSSSGGGVSVLNGNNGTVSINSNNGNQVLNLVWISNQSCYMVFDNVAIVNRIRFLRDNFTVKDTMIGFVNSVNEALLMTGECERLHYPRAFRITRDDNVVFRDEYNWTMTTSLILYMNNVERIGTNYFDRHGEMDTDGLEHALDFVKHRAPFLSRSNLNMVTERQMEKIVKTYYGVIYLKQKFCGTYKDAAYFGAKIKKMAIQILQFWPDRCYDGHHNLWVVKPAALSCGAGIYVTSDLEEIIDYSYREDQNYVVQKYIERPLLVHGTKFDIRQYFVISIDDTHFRGWYHPLCYIKLASEPFSLCDTAQAIHVTNTTVQRNYKNNASKEFPDHHMWSLEKLQDYFAREDKPDVYYKRIYPSMKKTLTQICEMCYENIEHRSGRFEIFGCDWIVTDDFKTQLLEINRGPSLEHFTEVSVVVLKVILEGLIKGGTRDSFFSCKILIKFIFNFQLG